MKFVGLDLADPNSERTILLGSLPAGLKIGQQVSMPGMSNRHRTLIVDILGSHSVQVKTFTRPSRGWARHTRRLKQEGHRQ